jgi:hypothetical protein
VVPDPPGDALEEAFESSGGVGLLDQLGARWYRLATRVEGPSSLAARQLAAIAERFVEARRSLNVLADRHLFVVARDWFPAP